MTVEAPLSKPDWPRRGHELEGRVAIVTGAAMGIGRACAIAMAAEGAAVVVADIEEGAGAATADAIRQDDGSALFVRTDVTLMSDFEAMARTTVKTFGGIDILVSNAACAIGGVVHETVEAT